MIGGILTDKVSVGEDGVEDIAPGGQGVLFVDVATKVEEAPNTIGLYFFFGGQDLILVSIVSRLKELELPSMSLLLWAI